MGRLSPRAAAGDEQDLQVIVDQQAAAIQLLHDAFAAERQAWSLEKDRLHNRIASLEKLLKMGDGYSPAKSPILSPFSNGSNGSAYASPNSKAMAIANSNRLPSIAEDERFQSLSQRRENAPQSIHIPASNHSERKGSVGFSTEDKTPTAPIKVEEIPISPPQTAKNLSPPPYNYRMDAGHTPIREFRPPTPPPQKAFTMDGIEDTPTRNNTHINAFLTRSNDEEEDKELKGPLNMPELPHQAGEENFTFEMLSKKLEQIEKNPQAETAKPMVFAQPSPGLASPAERAGPSPPKQNEGIISPKTVPPASSETENPASPTNTATHASANALSPSGMSALSQQVSHDDKVQADFESGGIRLKKKASSNFGAPFGQLGGFVRKQS